MSGAYGIRGKLKPEYPFKGMSERVFEYEGIAISVEDGMIKAEFSSGDKLDLAKRVITHVLDAWNARNNVKVTANLNHSWKPETNGGVAHQVNQTGVARVITNVVTHQLSYSTDTHLRKELNAYSFKHSIDLTEKALSNESLSKALHYISEEVVDTTKPLYGIYKAVEVLSVSLNPGGSKKLAEMAGQVEKYANDVKQTAQLTRHDASGTHARSVLTEQECRNRAMVLVEAYASSID